MPVIPVADFTDGLKGSAEQAFHAMEKMREMLKNDPEDGLDLLNGYVQQSPTCHELINQIQRNEFVDNDKAHVYAIDLLCRVMDGQFNHSSRTESTKTVVSVKILEELKVIYRLLGTENNYYLKTCLRCLSQMARLTATLLLAEFNFDYKPFCRLCDRRNWGPDRAKHVRSFYLLFAKTLLQSPDSAVVIRTLGIPKFIQPIFKLLHNDHPPYALEFITVIHNNVIDNRKVPRAPKKQIFNGAGVRFLSALLEHKDAKLADAARNMLQQYLTSTFFFRMHPKEVNALFDFCNRMRPLHARQQELILAIIQAHPHLYAPYVSKLSLVIYPRLAISWLWNLRFVSSLLRMERSAVDDRASMENVSAVDLCLPPKMLTATFLTQGVLYQEPIVADATISLIESILLRAKSLSGLMDEKAVAAFRRQLLGALPDLHTLLSLAKRLADRPVRTSTECSTPVAASAAAEALDETESPEAEADGEEEQAAEAARGQWRRIVPFLEDDCLVQWVNCMRLYLEVLPSVMRDCKFDWTKMLVTDKELLRSERSLAIMRLVETAFVSDGRFLGSSMSKQQQVYLDHLVHATVQGIKEAEQALCRLLRTFAIFDDAEGDAELDAWIQQLHETPQCAAFFIHVVNHVTAQPGFYISMSHDVHQTHAGDRPSLCYLAAVHQHALGFPRSVDGAPFLNGLASMLAVVLPSSAAGMLRVAKHFQWDKKDKKRGLQAALKDTEHARKRVKVRISEAPQSAPTASHSSSNDPSSDVIEGKKPSDIGEKLLLTAEKCGESEDDEAKHAALAREFREKDVLEFQSNFDWNLDGIRLRNTLDTFFSCERGPPDVYDLSFLLPFFHERLHRDYSTNSLPLRLVCQGGVLQVLLYGLATEWRSSAYQGLAIVDAALQTGWKKDDHNRMAFREVPQITLLLESLRNAIPAPESGYPRLAPLICAFMATAVGVMLRPDHSLYLDVGRFFLSRPHIDLEDVPMFCRLFYSERADDRKWIIKVLRRGGPNWSIFARRHVVQSILSFAGSTLCDFGAWADCLRFLGTLRPGSREDCGSGRLEDFGAPEWIIGETCKRYGNEKLESIALGKLIEFLGSMTPIAASEGRCDTTALLGAALSIAESARRLKSISLAQKLWPVVVAIAKVAQPTDLCERILVCFREIVPQYQWEHSLIGDNSLGRLCPDEAPQQLPQEVPRIGTKTRTNDTILCA